MLGVRVVTDVGHDGGVYAGTVVTDEAARALAAAAAAGLTVGPGEVAGLVVQSAEGVIEAATPAAEDILGLSLKQMLGRASGDPRWAAVDVHGVALRPRDHPALQALATGRPVRDAVLGVHRPGRDRAGEHVWLRVDSVPFNVVDGVARNVVVRFAVVTGQHAAELRLAESERLYRFLIDNAPDVVAWQLVDTTFLWVSPAVQTVLGHLPEDVVGRTAYAFMHPDDEVSARTTGWFDPAAATAPTPMLVRMRHRDGRYRWMEVAGQLVRDADGAPAQLRTSWRDVTARVDAERDRDAALQLVQSVVAHSPIGIAVSDGTGVLEQVNEALCTMLGRGADQLLGHRVDEFVHPDDTCPHDDAPLLAGVLMADESECRYLREDGSSIWGHRTTMVLRGGENDAGARLLIHLQDVTARRQAYDELRHAATHDALTGLANRVAFDAHLTDTRDSGAAEECSGLLFIDLDDFKAVNDNHGHEVGDEVLTLVADRIRGSIRPQDFAARMGGDEFVVLCLRLPDHETAVGIAERIVEALSTPFAVGTVTLTISASVGVTTGSGDDRRHLMTSADRAMYRAKQAGRGVVTHLRSDHRSSPA